MASDTLVLDLRNKRTGLKACLKALYSSESDSIIASLDVHGRGCYYLKIKLQPIRAAVVAALSNKVGWSWKDVKRVSAKVVKKVGNKKLLAQVSKVINDPRFAKGMALASAVYPPLGISYATLRSSVKLVNDAAAGAEEAQRNIKKIRALAKAGDPKAAKVAITLTALYKAKVDKGIDIGAWYNYVLKRNAATSPNTLRGIYSSGMKSGKRIINVTATPIFKSGEYTAYRY